MGQLAAVRGGGGGLDEALLRADRAPAAVGGATPALLSGSSFSGDGLSPAPGSPAMEASAAGIVARSHEEQAAIWREKGLRAAPPSVNYAKSLLAVVFGPGPEWVIEIAAVRRERERVAILYRLSPLPEGATRLHPALPYQYRVLSKTDLPIVFERVP
jgi:hypothetical protein